MSTDTRTWRARSKQSLDLGAFSDGDFLNATKEQDLAAVISKVLYPEDNHYEGKTLRLCQHYFLVSATLQYALKEFVRRFGRDFNKLPDKAVFHINDTHPGFVIPELMRLLMDEEGHIDFLETQIELVGKVGLQNYLQSQMGEVAS